MLLAGDFCSSGCSEHCVLACWWDGYAKGFNGKKNVNKHVNETNTQLFWIFSFTCCRLLSLVPLCPAKIMLCVDTNWIPDMLRCVLEKKRPVEMCITPLMFDALYQSCVPVRSAWCQFKGTHALYVCETLHTDLICLNWVFWVLDRSPFSQNCCNETII